MIEDIEDLRIESRKASEESRIKCENKTDAQCNFESFVPCAHRIYIKTWGCTHNTSDGEYMAGLLAEHGFMISDDIDVADIWVLNSCTVKSPSEDSLRNFIKNGKLKKIPIVVCGCVPQGEPNAKFIYGVSVLGTNLIDRIVEVVEETLKGNTVRMLHKVREDGSQRMRLSLPKIRKNKFVEIISISSGCLNQCTYCKTKHARGELGSYAEEEIIERARSCFDEGVVELWITSEDTGAYGIDIGSSLPKLLKKILNITPPHCMLRVGMTNPPYILEHMKEMSQILNHPNCYSFIHIPVQSGSDAVLNDMKREYNVEEFCTLVDFLTENVPGIHIATDVICGFPTETHEDFEETFELITKYKFNSLFINQYYPRAGTVAASWPQISPKIAKTRTKKISDYFKSYTNYEERVGKVYTILLTEIARDNLHYIGHNKYYEQILVPINESTTKLGEWIKVEIRETSKFYMKGIHLVAN